MEEPSTRRRYVAATILVIASVPGFVAGDAWIGALCLLLALGWLMGPSLRRLARESGRTVPSESLFGQRPSVALDWLTAGLVVAALAELVARVLIDPPDLVLRSIGTAVLVASFLVAVASVRRFRKHDNSSQ